MSSSSWGTICVPEFRLGQDLQSEIRVRYTVTASIFDIGLCDWLIQTLWVPSIIDVLGTWLVEKFLYFLVLFELLSTDYNSRVLLEALKVNGGYSFSPWNSGWLFGPRTSELDWPGLSTLLLESPSWFQFPDFPLSLASRSASSATAGRFSTSSGLFLAAAHHFGLQL